MSSGSFGVGQGELARTMLWGLGEGVPDPFRYTLRIAMEDRNLDWLLGSSRLQLGSLFRLQILNAKCRGNLEPVRILSGICNVLIPQRKQVSSPHPLVILA